MIFQKLLLLFYIQNLILTYKFFSDTNNLYNPIIIKKSEIYNIDKYFKDKFLIFGKNIDFIEKDNLIYSPKNDESKFPNMVNKELKNILEFNKYSGFKENTMIMNLRRKKKICKSNNYIFAEKEKDDVFLYKNIQIKEYETKEDILVIYLNKNYWEFFLNFQNFLINNIYYEEQISRIFLYDFCYKEYISDLFIDKTIPGINMKKFKISIFFNVTNLELQKISLISEDRLKNLNQVEFSSSIENLIQYHFLLTKNKLSTNNILYITKENKFLYPYLYPLKSRENNLKALTRILKNFLEKKFKIYYNNSQISILDGYFYDMYQIYENRNIDLENISLFENLKKYIRDLFFSKKSYEAKWEFYFGNKHIPGYYDDFVSNNVIDDSNSLFSPVPNDYFDSSESDSFCLILVLKSFFIWTFLF